MLSVKCFVVCFWCLCQICRGLQGEREPLTPADDQAKTGHNKPVSRYSPDHDRYKVWLLDGTEMEVAVTVRVVVGFGNFYLQLCEHPVIIDNSHVTCV